MFKLVFEEYILSQGRIKIAMDIRHFLHCVYLSSALHLELGLVTEPTDPEAPETGQGQYQHRFCQTTGTVLRYRHTWPCSYSLHVNKHDCFVIYRGFQGTCI